MGKQQTLQVLYNQEVASRSALENELRKVRDELEVQRKLNADTARLWHAFSIIPDACAIYDSDDNIVIANEAYKNMYDEIRHLIKRGLPRNELVSAALDAGILLKEGKSKDEWINGMTDPDHIEGGVKRVIQTGDGRILRVTSTRAENGDLISYRADITKEFERQKELEAAHIAAQDASKIKSAFLASMSHEIRTPMNGVIGMADLLCETQLDDEQTLYADTIRSSGESLLVIINDILDFSKIEAGQMELFLEPFNLEKAAHEACMLLRSKANDKGIDLLLDYDMFLPVWFDGDAGRIRQVLLNLISNAVKFTQAGHVCVHVVGVPIDDGKYELHVAVEDTGIGIPKTELAKVFKEFAQVDQEENRKFEGTGLGLAISKRLIEQMDGEIWVDSEDGVGSVFGFKIPLTCYPEEALKIPRVPNDVSHVIVVDDVKENRTILLKQLGSLGLTVSTFSNADDVLDAFDAGQRFDMVITDQLMPEKTGTMLAQSLRDRGFEGLVVLLSSGAKPFDAKNSERRIFDSILQKPALRTDLYKSLKLVFDPEPTPRKIGRTMVTSPLETRALRLLLAEDNKTNQLVFKKMLKSAGYDLRVAGDGSELLTLFKAERADIVFTDVSMPVMDGIEATQAIRAYEAEAGLMPVPIVALTAHAMQGDKERFIEAGMDDYLSKPLKKDKVLELIELYQTQATDNPFSAS